MAVRALLLATAISVAMPAWGQGEKEAAQVKLDEAIRLDGKGDYQGALRSLMEAYVLYPSPILHFNVGQTYLALGRDVEALDSFDRYLAETDANAERRREATEHIEQIRRRVATIEVTSDAEGAEIVVDGRKYGRTPAQHPIRVAPGPHQVVVQKGGHHPFLDRVDAAGGEKVRVHARLSLVALPPPPTRSPPMLVTAEPLPAPAKALHRRWWFWTAAAAVAGAAVVGIIVAGREQPFCPDCLEVYPIGGSQ